VQVKGGQLSRLARPSHWFEPDACGVRDGRLAAILGARQI